MQALNRIRFLSVPFLQKIYEIFHIYFIDRDSIAD